MRWIRDPGLSWSEFEFGWCGRVFGGTATMLDVREWFVKRCPEAANARPVSQGSWLSDDARSDPLLEIQA